MRARRNLQALRAASTDCAPRQSTAATDGAPAADTAFTTRAAVAWRSCVVPAAVLAPGCSGVPLSTSRTCSQSLPRSESGTLPSPSPLPVPPRSPHVPATTTPKDPPRLLANRITRHATCRRCRRRKRRRVRRRLRRARRRACCKRVSAARAAASVRALASARRWEWRVASATAAVAARRDRSEVARCHHCWVAACRARV